MAATTGNTQSCGWQKGKTDDGAPGYLIRSEKFQTITHFTPQAVLSNDWPALWGQVVQGRDVIHMSRICGYFSNIHNWNQSKKGELKDRQKGDYSLWQKKDTT